MGMRRRDFAIKNEEYRRNFAKSLLVSMNFQDAADLCIRQHWDGTLHVLLNSPDGRAQP